MSQMIVSARNENQGIALNCPHCKFTCRHDVSHVEDCIKLREPLVCVACGEEFQLVTVSQIRPPEQSNDAETPIREALCDCKTHHNFQEVAINHCFECNKPLHS
jgi:hypothetical protein